jgi:hypothetical protein
MTKEQILSRIDALLSQCEQVMQSARDVSPEQVVSGALTVMSAIYGERSPQTQSLVKRVDEIGKGPMPSVRRKPAIGEAARGVLQNAREEIQAGLLTSLQRQITADVLADLLQLAREALKESADGAKNVAAVLAAAAFEDTIRRIAREHAGIIGQDKLESVIVKLKDAGLLVSPQLGIATSYLSFRNHALHAEWDKIDRSAVSSVLAFVEQLLLKHFA